MNHTFFFRLMWDGGIVTAADGGVTRRVQRHKSSRLPDESWNFRVPAGVSFTTPRGIHGQGVIPAVLDLRLCLCVCACTSILPAKVLSIFH